MTRKQKIESALKIGEEHDVKYIVPNVEVRFLLSELQTLQAERDKLIDGLHLWIRKTDDEETQKYLTRLLEGIGVTV